MEQKARSHMATANLGLNSEIFGPASAAGRTARIVAKVDELMAICDRLESQLTTAQTESRRLLEAVLHEALAPAIEQTRRQRPGSRAWIEQGSQSLGLSSRLCKRSASGGRRGPRRVDEPHLDHVEQVDAVLETPRRRASCAPRQEASPPGTRLGVAPDAACRTMDICRLSKTSAVLLLQLGLQRTGHVHVRRERMVASSGLNQSSCANHGFSARELNQIRTLIQANLKKIQEAWREHCG